jgi:uncharacterized coiled-coil DUF342 family protein
MKELETLLTLKNQWIELIDNMEHKKQEALEMMLGLRKEISILSQLKLIYPQSTHIDSHIREYDLILEKISAMFDQIKNNLSEFRQQQVALEQKITEYENELTKLPPSHIQP